MLLLVIEFCACVIRIRDVPQLQVILMERLYYCMIDGFTIALLLSEFGEVWASYDFVKRVAQTLIQVCKA